MKRAVKAGTIALALALACGLGSRSAPAAESPSAEPGADAKMDSGSSAPKEKPLTRAELRELKKKERAEKAKAEKRVLTKRNSKLLLEAREFLQASNYDKASGVIDKLMARRINLYERSLALRTRAYIAHGRGQLDEAIGFLRQAIALNILPQDDQADLLFQIAQIQSTQRKWREAIATLGEWFTVSERPGSAAYLQLALAHYQLKEFDEALDAARKGIALAEIPQQSWLQLVVAIELTRENYPGATSALIELLTFYPRASGTNWLQLATLYGLQADVPRALAVFELAYHQGFLSKDPDLRRLAQLSLAQDMPTRAIGVVEHGVDTQQIAADASAYDLLGSSWILAREPAKAEPALSRAAELSDEGSAYVRLAQVLMLDDRWADAVSALARAQAKGDMDNPGAADLLLGIAYYNEKNLDEARNCFMRARRSEKTRGAAENWLQQIDYDRRRGQASGTS